MKKTLKKSVSILLSLIMIFSVFAIVPITASAASTYTKDSAGIADGIILENPGDTIDTSGTSCSLLFVSDITCDYYNDGTSVYDVPFSNIWSDIDSLYIDDNNEFICYSYGDRSKLTPDDGKVIKVSYRSDLDLWIIAAVYPGAASQPPAFYTKDSEGIADGIILDSSTGIIITVNTSKRLVFDCTTQCDAYNDGTSVYDISIGRTFYDIYSFFVDENNDFLFNNFGTLSKLMPGDGKVFEVSYDAGNDEWHINEGSDPASEPTEAPAEPTEAPASASFVKVTDEPDDWSGDYLIVYENENGSKAFNGSSYDLNTAGNCIDVTISNGEIASDDSTNAAKVTIAQIDGGYSIATAGGTYIGGQSGVNKIISRDEAILNTISLDDEDYAVIVSNSTYFRYNTSWPGFRYYKSVQQQPVTLYKLTGGSAPAGETITLDLNADNADIYWDDSTAEDEYWRIDADYDDGNKSLTLTADDVAQAAGTFTIGEELSTSSCCIIDPEASEDIYFTAGSCTVTVDGDTVTVEGSFTGSDGNTYNVTITYVAPTYTITWNNWDDTELEKDTGVAEGANPEYNGATPQKPDDATNYYTFSGWTPEVTAVTGDETYTAQFTATEKPEVIKDCNNKYGNFRLYSNVPIVQFSNSDALLTGAIIPITYGDNNSMIPLVDAKGYSYKLYNQTGTEIPFEITSSNSEPGSGYGFSDDVTVYTNVLEWTLPANTNALYIVATAPTVAPTEPATDAPTDAPTEAPVTDTYTVAGSSPAMFGTAWDASNSANDMTLSEGVYSITYTDVQPEETIQLKVVKNHAWFESWGDKATGQNYIFNVKSTCDVTVSFDPATETVSVTGDGVTQDTELDVYSVIAVGNGEDTYLNGSIWDPCDPANALTEIADGVWELTMTDIYAFDNYCVKFAVNSVDENGNPTSNPWTHNFGSEVEQLYPTGAAIDAVHNGKNCIFEVEEDGSTVTLQLDLTNYDHATKQGARMTIFVNASEESTEESTEEATDEPPALTVKAMIEALPSNITLDNAADVQAARQAYDALPDTDKAQIDAATLKKLTDAEAKIADLTAAKAVSDAITALPTADQVTYNNKTAIESASAAFNALTDAQKALVDSSLKQKLTADVTALEFVVHVHDAEALINALPAAANIALTDKTAVQAARAAYDALTGPEKGAIDANALTKLTNAEAKIADLEAAKAVTDAINSLPANIALTNKTAVQNARTAYNALTDAQKALIDANTLKKLTDAEQKITDLEAAKAVTDAINALPAAANVALTDKTNIQNARTAYNALTDAQKALVDANTLKKLTDDEQKITDLEAAKAVTDSINALPAAANVALTDKTAIQNARTAYNALTDAQKALVDANTLKKLTDDEAKITDLEAAKAVSDAITALPTADQVTYDNKTAIESASAAFNALTNAQKALVDSNIKQKLTADLTALEFVVHVHDAEALINALPAAANIALTDKTAVQAARAAYNALTGPEKGAIDAATLQKLTDAEQKIADLEAAKAVTDTINALPAAANVALTDKTAIQNARTAYNALTDAQKALVDANTLKKLTDDEQKITDLEAAKAVTDAINALPGTDNVTLDDKATVDAARAAYDALTEAQKKLVDKNTLKKLTDDEEKLAELQAMSEVSAKTGKDATYNGKELPLVNAPTTALPEGCTMKYALGKDADTPPADDQFTADVPTAKDAGIYYVWYKAVGDEGHPSTEPECKIVRLAKAVLTVIAKNQTVQYGDPVVQGRYTVKGLAKGDKVVVKLHAKIATNEVKSTVTANKNYTVKKVSGILTIKNTPIAKALPSGNTISVSYAKVKNADGYDIYAGYCGSNSYPLAKAVKGGAVTSAKLTLVGGKAIDTKKNVFLYVVAYKNVGGKKVTLVRSTSIRIAGLNTKHTNAKSVGGVKPAVTLKKGATLILKPSVTPVDPKKPVYANPAKFMFASHNNSVATVDAKGRITAVGKGTANIYTYASNGVKTLTVVTVK